MKEIKAQGIVEKSELRPKGPLKGMDRQKAVTDRWNALRGKK